MDVPNVAFDRDLRAFSDAPAAIVDADVHGRFAAAIADRLQFFEAIGEGQEVSRSGKRIPEKVAADSVTDDRDVSDVRGAFPKTIDRRELEPGDLDLSSFPASKAVIAIVAVDGCYFDVYSKDFEATKRLHESFPDATAENPDLYF